MKKRQVQLVVVAGFLVLVAFLVYRGLTASPTPPTSASGWSPPGPQAKLPTVKLWVGAQELVAEVARKPEEVATGLMFRTNLAPNEAMLFLLPVPQRAEFYMRNTLLALSCAYMDDEGVIQEIHDMKPKDETSIPSASANIRLVLEVNRGWFEANHINPDVLIRTERGPLSELSRREHLP